MKNGIIGREIKWRREYENADESHEGIVIDKVMVSGQNTIAYETPVATSEHQYLIYTDSGIELIKPSDVISVTWYKNDVINRI